jgi:site-specific DNA recombinase
VVSELAESGLKRKPCGIGIERLRDPPAEGSRQFEALGINPE